MQRGGLNGVPGDVAEVWRDGRKVGVVFRWTLKGVDGYWKATGTKSLLEKDFDGGECEIRFFITSKSRDAVRFVGRGHILDPVCTGELTYGEVEIIGTSLTVETADVAKGGSPNGTKAQAR